MDNDWKENLFYFFIPFALGADKVCAPLTAARVAGRESISDFSCGGTAHAIKAALLFPNGCGFIH
jgi:hypothetical protein